MNHAESPVIENKINYSTNDILVLLCLFAYLFVDYIPQFSSFSASEPQWIYLSVLNCLVFGYTLYDKTITSESNRRYFDNIISILYGVFVLLSGISIYFAKIQSEGLITFSRYFVVFVSFLNLYILLKGRKYLFFSLAKIIVVLLFIECVIELYNFFNEFNTKFIFDLKNETSFNHGNKNIFAANILIKLPFVIYCILNTSKYAKTFYIIILFVVSLNLFLLGSRAINIGMISLFILIPLLLLTLKYRSEHVKSSKEFLIYPVFLIITYFLSILIIQSGEFMQGDNKSNAANVLQTINSGDASLNARFGFWKSALEYIPHNLFHGTGLGNWKFESMKDENAIKGDSYNGVYMHNDFLEVTAESGILNGLIFLSIFLSIVFINLKGVLDKKSSSDKLVNIIILASISAFLIDTLFNFPLARPTMQIIFVLLLILTIINKKEIKNSIQEIKKTNYNYFLVFVLFLNIINVYPNFLINKNSKALNLIDIDKIKLDMSYEKVNQMLGKFPEYDVNGTPLEDIKTRYLINEGRYKEALNLIDISKWKNPNSTVYQDLKGLIYVKIGAKDSVYKYYKQLHEKCPNHKDFYGKYLYSLSKFKDTSEILKTYNNLDKKAKKAKHYYFTYLHLSNSGYDFYKSLKYINDGLELFPYDTILGKVNRDYKNNKIKLHTEKRIVPIPTQNSSNPNVFTKNDYIIKSNEFTNKGQYKQALEYCLKAYKMDKNDIIVIENLGLTYFNLHQFENTLKYLNIVLDAKTNPTGKIELVAAACHFNLKNKQKACELAKIALSKNYPDSQKYTTQFCN